MENDQTVYVGNLDNRVDEVLLQELFMQFAPVKNVKLPRDRISGQHQGYGFVQLSGIEDVSYVVKLLNGMALYSKNLRVNTVKR
jgi:splicing factor 3B subunit 4